MGQAPHVHGRGPGAGAGMSGQRKKGPTLAPAGVLSTREKLWRAMRELKEFRVPDLARATGVWHREYNIQDYLRGLIKAGIVAVKERPQYQGAHATYTLVRDLGVDAPRVRRDGTAVAEPAQEIMWRGMKILREFTVLDLLAHAAMGGITIKGSTANKYCQWLARGGYLMTLGRPSTGQRFRLVLDTGPKAPQVLRVKQLLDVNTGKVMAGQSVEDAFDEGAA